MNKDYLINEFNIEHANVLKQFNNIFDSISELNMTKFVGKIY
jgi:hypothetical protein